MFSSNACTLYSVICMLELEFTIHYLLDFLLGFIRILFSRTWNAPNMIYSYSLPKKHTHTSMLDCRQFKGKEAILIIPFINFIFKISPFLSRIYSCWKEHFPSKIFHKNKCLNIDGGRGPSTGLTTVHRQPNWEGDGYFSENRPSQLR